MQLLLQVMDSAHHLWPLSAVTKVNAEPIFAVSIAGNRTLWKAFFQKLMALKLAADVGVEVIDI